MVERKNFNSPDETMNPTGNVKVEVMTVGGLTLQRITAQPGWQWSKDLKPVVKTESCQKDHRMYILSGKGHVRMDDGKEEDFSAGDAIAISPGHDGWTVGNEPVVWLELPH